MGYSIGVGNLQTSFVSEDFVYSSEQIKSRFMIAYMIPEETRQELSLLCQTAIGKPFEIDTPHITIIPPFFLLPNIAEQVGVEQIENSISRFAHQSIIATAERIDQFVQEDGNIVYLEIEPEDKFTVLHDQLENSLLEIIQIDIAPYASGIVPEFKPHLSIAYKTQPISKENQQTTQALLKTMNLHWKLLAPTLLVEEKPRVWVTMGSNH